MYFAFRLGFVNLEVSVKYVTKLKRSMADECKQIVERRTCRLCLGYVADAHILAGFGVQYRQLLANMLETRADKRLRVDKLRNHRDRRGSSLSTSRPIILVDVSQITKNLLL